mmetsp:Transcript_14876/g.19407  ORF Transcript_14876/g.19407 Transcript_14876/m.19407 type:complete len:87 (+) Transcript_14876:52-312(+)
MSILANDAKKRILLENIKNSWNCQSHQMRSNNNTKYPVSYIQYSISNIKFIGKTSDNQTLRSIVKYSAHASFRVNNRKFSLTSRLS